MIDRIAVLGSARLGESDPTWEVGHELGRLLAEAGFEVMTGGYGGLMAAVSRGAHEAGGHVIGLPMTAWTHLEPNEWNAELVWADDYPRRLAEMLSCRAVVALDGGIGTLSELAVVWSARQTEDGAPVLIAVGDRWRRILGELSKDLIANASDFELVTVVATPAEALEAIRSPKEVEPPGARG
jgi:uncharacterized protein (TIGR00730 family)